MAYGDIRPFKSALGGHIQIRSGVLKALGGAAITDSFNFGEPVMVDNAGGIATAPKDDTQWLIADLDSGLQCGIACWGPGAATATTEPGNFIKKDWRTGNNMTTGAIISFYPADDGNLFITDNFTAAGAGSAVVPASTDVGEMYQITYAQFGTPDSGWGVEQTAGVPGTDVCASVWQVLNARYEPLGLADTTTGVYVVFSIIAR